VVRGGTCELVLVAMAVAVAGCGIRYRSSGTGLAARRLMVPVAGVAPSKIPDTFNAPRDGGRRRHNALDILAPIGTPVLSADDGVVLALRSNRLGGRVIYAADPSRRFVYYYAHLSGYHPSLGPGRALRRGDVIGYVGATGNADPRVPHLHFQVMAFPPDDRWWTGTPIDPLPYLASPGRQVTP
jgi:murein DD-endopeptidase MepM/ murein hydrolase activator NlpD